MKQISKAALALGLFGSLLLAQQQAPPGQQQPSPAQPTQPTQPTQPGRTTVPTQPTQPQQQQPRQPTEDQLSRGRMSGRIVPSPGTRVRVDLYSDGMRLDTTYSDLDGGFRFTGQLTMASGRFEIRVEVGPGKEYVEEVDFGFNQPVMIHIRPQGIRDADFGVDKSKGVVAR